MPDKETTLDDRVAEMLADKTGFLPEEIDSRQRFLKTTRSMLNFYSNEYGLHLEPEQQTQVAKLVHSCDVLVLTMSQLEFHAKNLETDAYKAAILNKPFNPDPKLTSELKQKLDQSQKQLLDINNQTVKLVERFHGPQSEN